MPAWFQSTAGQVTYRAKVQVEAVQWRVYGLERRLLTVRFPLLSRGSESGVDRLNDVMSAYV